MTVDADSFAAHAADRLVALYEQPFGGKIRGRYRVSMKLMRRLLDQRRVWPEQIEAIQRELYQRGFVLLDLETYFVVVNQQTFASYRRINEEGLFADTDPPPPEQPGDAFGQAAE